MKTDYHVHIGHDTNRWGFRLTPEEVVSGMDTYGIGRSVVFACPNVVPSQSDPYLEDNREVLHASQKYSRLTPFMFVHPYRDSPKQIDENREHFAGFKVYCNAEGMAYPYDEIHRTYVMQRLLETGKPILFHIGAGEGERIINLSRFLSEAESPVILAHAGRFFKTDLCYASNIPNVYIDIAPLRLLLEKPMFVSNDFRFEGNFERDCEMMREYIVPLFDKRVLWGSDRPWPDNLASHGFEGENQVYEIFKEHLGEITLS